MGLVGGRQKPHPAGLVSRVHDIAFALPLPRFAAQTAGPVSPTPTPRRFAAAPDSGAPSTRRATGTSGSADPWSAGCSRQRSASLADHGSVLPILFFLYVAGRAQTVRAGREGLVGALSAMDGAKRGPHGCGFCRPPPTPPARPGPTPVSRFQRPTTKGSAVRRNDQYANSRNTWSTSPFQRPWNSASLRSAGVRPDSTISCSTSR